MVPVCLYENCGEMQTEKSELRKTANMMGLFELDVKTQMQHPTIESCGSLIEADRRKSIHL
jgi:hypothetical protein